MTERTPEFSMEVPGLRVDVFVAEGGEQLSEREQTMLQIVNYLNWEQYDKAQELVESSGIKASEAMRRFPPEE